MADHREREQARADLKTAFLGFALALTVLAIVIGGASALAMFLH